MEEEQARLPHELSGTSKGLRRAVPREPIKYSSKRGRGGRAKLTKRVGRVVAPALLARRAGASSGHVLRAYLLPVHSVAVRLAYVALMVLFARRAYGRVHLARCSCIFGTRFAIPRGALRRGITVTAEDTYFG